MWPVPRDRESLLAALPEVERVVQETANADNPRDAQRHANELFSLGEIRFRLRELPEAERIFDEVATEFLNLDNPAGEQSNHDWSVMARIRQSNVAALEGRFADAVAIIDRLVDEAGGLPELKVLSRDWEPLTFSLWLTSLEEIQAFECLYTVSETALARLQPAASANERVIYARAIRQRAVAAAALGATDEAVVLYKKAIAEFEAVDTALGGRELIATVGSLGTLLVKLERPYEAFPMFGHLVALMLKRPRLAMIMISPPWTTDATGKRER